MPNDRGPASQLTEEQIDDVVCEIMERDGPDRHVDGHEVITAFILALMRGDGRQWAIAYAEGPDHG